MKYFTLRGPIPGLSPHYFFGNTIQSGLVLKDLSLHEVYRTFKSRFGDVFQFWLGPWRVIVVSNIIDVQHIYTHRNIYEQGDILVEQFKLFLYDALICLKGAKFKRHASLTIPLFRRNKIIPNFDLIIDCTDKLLSQWRSAPSNHIHLDIGQQCRNLLLLIFGFLAFDYDLKTFDNSDHNELTRALKDFLESIYPVFFLPKVVSIIYLRLSRRYQRARTVIQQYVYRIIDHELIDCSETIAERKRTSLIASLVSALQNDEKTEMIKSEEEKKGLNRSEVLHEVLFFLLAGYETTSTALTWFIHLASKHPRVQQKIKAELLENNCKEDLSLEHLDSLGYLDCVITEVLRFCPPGDSSARTLTMDDRLPESGTQLYAGDEVLVPFMNLARDPRYWSIDPELFYPERFLGEDKNHQSYALLPFGGGHRQCIGQDLARFELKVIIARLMQHVTFGDGGPEVNAGGFVQTVTIMPKHVGVTVQFD
ncbi:unnamed protein product [Adineta steineri]|uniref:Cytochrome P450 n=2 Tax=Adineta steineri TaxID=433720 RepID=A0A815T0M1_9BILA|nr:unnamed protein product [Adineta steineri]CAF1644504.1 unnamed protein product [Adineta steineri]